MVCSRVSVWVFFSQNFEIKYVLLVLLAIVFLICIYITISYVIRRKKNEFVSRTFSFVSPFYNPCFENSDNTIATFLNLIRIIDLCCTTRYPCFAYFLYYTYSARTFVCLFYVILKIPQSWRLFKDKIIKWNI